MSDIQWLLEIVRAMGIAGGPLGFGLWWLERTERKASQKESRELLIQVLTTTAQATTSIVEVTKAVAAVGDGTKDMVESLSRLAELVRSFSDSLRRGK